MQAQNVMEWFDLLATPLMLVMLPVICWLTPSLATSLEDKSALRRSNLGMALLMVLSLAVFVFVYGAFGVQRTRGLGVLIVLQIPLFQRSMAIRRQSTDRPRRSPRRVATLTSRAADNPVPIGAWIAAWIAWGLLASLTAAGYAAHQLPSRLNATILLYVAFAAACLAFGPTLSKLVLREPEPMDPGESPELRAEYQRHRRARIWLFYALSVTMSVLLAGGASAIAWIAVDAVGEQRIGLYGGIVGAVIGVLGGVAGIYFGLWRSRLNRRVQGLSQQALE